MGMAVRRSGVVNRTCIRCLYILIITLQHIKGTDILTKDSPLFSGETLVSSNQIFELGFFIPGNSTNQYLGLWFKDILPRKILWVANRQNPISLSNTNSTLTISNDGNLRILDADQNTVWSTRLRIQSNKTIAKLTNVGDFTLNDTISGLTLWQSFDHPSNILLPGMRLGTNETTQGKNLLTSWKSSDDPTPGDFVLGLSEEQPPQAFTWRGSKPYWRSGPWDGGKFIGIPEQDPGYFNRMTLTPENSQGGAYLTINLHSSFDTRWLFLSHDGVLKLDSLAWNLSWKVPLYPCDVYGVCGAFSVCKDRIRICECLRGFVPRSNDEWSKSNWKGGCVRRIEVSCEKNESSLGSGKIKPDIFQEVRGIKLPDHHQYFPYMDKDECQTWCLGNCSCKAYAFVEGIHCMVWEQDLIDIQQLSFGGENLFLHLAYEESGKFLFRL